MHKLSGELEDPRIEPLLQTGKKVGRKGTGLDKMVATSKRSRPAENRMEYTTDETETPVSTQGASRITREVTDNRKRKTAYYFLCQQLLFRR
jgi:hypothetical protein